MIFNKNNPYSNYQYLFDYPETVGQFCSILWYNKICSSEDINKILLYSELFKNLEEEYNPMLLTSDEAVWIEVLLRDKNLNKLFNVDIEKFSKLRESNELKIDWLSMWSGSVIATLAIYYGVSLKEIIKVMGFEEFMQLSPGLHSQPNGYIFDVFSKKALEGFKLTKTMQDFDIRLFDINNFCVLPEEVSKTMMEIFDVKQQLQQTNKLQLVMDYYTYDVYGTLAAFAAINPGQDLLVTLRNYKTKPNIQNIDEYNQTYDGLMLTNNFGAWHKQILFLNTARDKGKYLKTMMSYIKFFNQDWINTNSNIIEKQLCIPAELIAIAAEEESKRREAFMRVPLR